MHVPYRILVPRRGLRRLGGVAPARVRGCSPDHCAGSIRVDTPSGVVDTAPAPPNDRRGTRNTPTWPQARFRGPAVCRLPAAQRGQGRPQGDWLSTPARA